MNQKSNQAEKLLANDPASRMLGITLTSIDDDSVCLTMKVTAAMTNGYDICHGGFIYTLGDTCSAFASAKPGFVVLSSTNQIDYLAPAMVNDVLSAAATIISEVGRQLFYDVKICNQDEKVIALMRSKLIRQEQS